MSPEAFDRECRDLARELSGDDGLSRHERRRRDRNVARWVDKHTGAAKTLLTLDPASDAKVWAAINAAVAQARAAHQDAELTFDQLRADAVADLITGARAVDRRVPEVSVLIDWATLIGQANGVCETSNREPLPVDTVRRLCCDADIVPIVPGAHREVLDAGHSTRLATRPQRRALRAMYATCAHPTCQVGFDNCRIHHVDHWEHQGRTDLNRLIPVCEHHHHLIHEGRWTLHLEHDPARTITLTQPDGTIHFSGPSPNRRPAAHPSADNRPQFAKWLAAGPLSPASTLFREDDYLLTEERSLSDRSLYHSVVGAIAGGNTTQAAIARALGREQRPVQHPLRALQDVGFVVAANDALRSRRPIYRIADPIVRFHHVVTRRDLARFEDRRTADAWEDAQPRFRTHVLGPHFEHLAREFTFRFASTATVGGSVASVGPAVVNDATRRTQHELDVVALAREQDGSSRVVAIGESKHSTSKRSLSDLMRLDDLRRLIAVKHPSARTARLLLFSASGFQEHLESAAADRADVELIDIDRLYHGD